jgi:hypothetical protein
VVTPAGILNDTFLNKPMSTLKDVSRDVSKAFRPPHSPMVCSDKPLRILSGSKRLLSYAVYVLELLGTALEMSFVVLLTGFHINDFAHDLRRYFNKL